MERDLLRSAGAVGPSTLILATEPSTPAQSHSPMPESTSSQFAPLQSVLLQSRVDLLNEVARRAVLTAVFSETPAPAGRRYRAVSLDAYEPLAVERSLIVVAPMFTAVLLAVDRGQAPDGARVYDYRLSTDRDVVLDAATVLLRRIPTGTATEA
ncbi:hypothetical protein ACFVKB_45675 [Rhodococcus sp. NPDC127530]|uniref:hypothetical protein n=1 Tax=unclassified Rhodococcus (in: high G+C Gram-positive bacteria) TaxID=192944 RepID=UPI00364455A4